MTIENSNSVDGIGTSKWDGTAVLTIADHLDWSDEPRHFDLLKKFNTYLGFIKSGQLLEVMPEARGRDVRIEMFYQNEPSLLGSRFLEAAKQQLQKMGVVLVYGALPDKYSRQRVLVSMGALRVRTNLRVKHLHAINDIRTKPMQRRKTLTPRDDLLFLMECRLTPLSARGRMQSLVYV